MSLQKQFLTFWNKQSFGRRTAFVVLLLAVAILVPVLITWATAPSYVVAYSGLTETDAAQVVQKLTESSIPYQLKNSSTILVPSDQVYEVRLQMARDGLPKSSTVGYELFSGSTLGMNEFTQRINYQRALEGELERTIGSLQAVDTVRVHVVTPEKSLLSSNQAPTTASVTVKEKSGMRLDKSQVSAITHLVASSVEGMTPENVVVVDNQGAMLTSGGASGVDVGSTATDSQRTAESAAADEVRRKIQAMLDRILGPNQSTVVANVSMDWTQREVTSSLYNPTPAAIRSSQKTTENYTTSSTTGGGIPGAGTNLPTALPVSTTVAGVNTYSKTDETINYEVSKVESKEIITPGKVNQVMVSVMVNKITDPAQLDSIKAAVTAAGGINASRGDTVVVETMAFDNSYYDQQAADLAKESQYDLIIRLAPLGVGVLAALLLLILVLRSMANIRKASQAAWTPILKPVNELALEALNNSGDRQSMMGMNMNLGSGMTMPSMDMPQQSMQQSSRPIEEYEPSENSARRTQQTQEDEQRTKIINKLTEESPATVAEIIQVWLSEDGKSNA